MDPRLGADDRSPIGKFLLLLSAAVGLLIWAHWTDLVETAQHWGQDAQYSHGYLVPAFALALLWKRRALLQPGPFTPAWWGLPFHHIPVPPEGKEAAETAQLGLLRNLTAAEIVEQIIIALNDAYGVGVRPPRGTNLVGMGAGEPFLNFDALMKRITSAYSWRRS